jgi:uncharacterized repeat protein (TIGR01451 family)
MSKLTSLIRRAPKRLIAGALMIAAAVIIPATLFAYGPDRPTYTFAHPADHVTFNSITDNPSVGDERNFVRIKESSNTTTYGKTVDLTPGKKYQVEVYFHNNAATDLNASGAGIAKDVTLRMQIPGVVNAGATANITGYINSSNASPTSVWDSSTATNSTAGAVAIRYVANSAKVTSNGAVNGATLPDTLFTTGTNLGYDSLNGVIPGCNQYAGYVVFEFAVEQPNFTVQKQVSTDAGKTWSTNATTTPGSTVLYRVIYTNTGTTQQDDVTITDTLPQGVTYVPGSTLIANTKTGGSYKATLDGVTSNGLNIGSYSAAGNAYVKFSAKVADNIALTCGTNILHNVASVWTTGGSKESAADVTVNKECKPNECLPGIPTGDKRCELPHTGPTDTILGFLGLGAIVASLGYFVASRRALQSNK